MNHEYVVDKKKILNKANNTAAEGSLIAIVGQWVQSQFNSGNDNRITAARNLGSGWELWAQTELGLWINTRLGTGTATRIAGIYTSLLYADLVIHDGGSAVHVIELKCNGLSDNNAQTLANGLEADYLKLMNEKLQGQYKGAKKWIIGINIGSKITQLQGMWPIEEIKDYEGQAQLYYRVFGGDM